MKPIENAAEHRAALKRVDALWSAPHGSPAAEELLALADAIEAYEHEYLRAALPPARPQAVIKYKLRELGWSRRELGRRLGWSSGRVSAVISGKRGVTVAMVRDLSEVLGVAPQLLQGDRASEPPQTWVRVPTSLARCALERGLLGRRSLDALVGTALSTLLAPGAAGLTFTGPRASVPAATAWFGVGARALTLAPAWQSVAA